MALSAGPNITGPILVIYHSSEIIELKIIHNYFQA